MVRAFCQVFHVLKRNRLRFLVKSPQQNLAMITQMLGHTWHRQHIVLTSIKSLNDTSSKIEDHYGR